MNAKPECFVHWTSCRRGRLSALEFEPIWERALAELGNAGFGRSYRETLLAYLEKLPPGMRKDILRVRRGYGGG